MLQISKRSKIYLYPLIDFNEDTLKERIYIKLPYYKNYPFTVIEELNETFFIDKEFELNELLSNYPFNESDLIPPSDYGIFYTPEMLETYRNNKILEIVPAYVFDSLKSWSYDYLIDLYEFLVSNFGEKNYIVKIGDSYYSLKENQFIIYNIDTMHLY